MHDLPSLLPLGVVSRAELSLGTSRNSVSRWVSRGDLVELHPGVVALPGRAPEFDVRARAALIWTDGVLSHGSALVAHGLLAKDMGPIHVTVGSELTPRGSTGVVVHRTTRPLSLAASRGFTVTPLATSLVEAWSWGSAARWNPRAHRDLPAARQALIHAVREGRVGVAAVRTVSAAHGRHPGTRSLGELLDLLDQGCRSELEVFGVLHVLRIPGLPTFVQQYRVTLLDGRRLLLDALFREAGVVVELDGHRFHSSRKDRERDMRRDTGLAMLGYLVLRFSYERLTSDPAGCRREIEAVVRRRLAERRTVG